MDPRILTPRQTQMVELVARGLTNKQIAAHLGISVQTVKNTLTEARIRTCQGNRTCLALWYARTHGGLVEAMRASAV